MTKENPNNGNETKSDIFPRECSKVTPFFTGRKILNYVNDLHNWRFSIPLQK